MIYFFKFDGTNFSLSQFDFLHDDVMSLGNYGGQPFTTGGSGSGQTETEILTIASDTWRSGTKYPYSDR